jgi:outer membrane protein OmpA-like peptidoglycan-associated protein
MKARTTRNINLLFALLLLAGCEGSGINKRETGAIGGAALGAGLGAIIGNQTGSTGAGIAIGSAVGALSGALIGNNFDNSDRVADEQDERLRAQAAQLEENKRLIEELRSRGSDARVTDRGVVVNLPDVLFEFDSATLTSDAQSAVRNIAEVVGTSGTRRVSVEGHTDSVGTVNYNQQLSEQRARSVAHDLAAAGIPRRSISSRGYGEGHPIASNQTTQGRQRNRRVEVVIENQ